MQHRAFARLVAPAATSGLAAALVIGVPSAASADACATMTDVKAQVSALVEDLRADVPSRDARAAVRLALVQSVRTARGAEADTATERAALGVAISALARTLKDAPGLVERKAIVAAIHALTEQREANGLTAEERATLQDDLEAVRSAVVRKLDTAEERAAFKAEFRALLDAMHC